MGISNVVVEGHESGSVFWVHQFVNLCGSLELGHFV